MAYNNSTSPASKFGGSWSQITGRFLYCNTGTTAAGANNQTLTARQIPEHAHRLRMGWGSACGQGWYALSANDGSGSSWGTLAGVYNVHEIGDNNNNWYTPGTSPSHNNMPAYQTVYCWRRTA